jgi:hypothetical protein
MQASMRPSPGLVSSRRSRLVQRDAKEAKGKLRCEGAGAVVINVDGTDYAVNGMAGSHYPPIERLWSSMRDPLALESSYLSPTTVSYI